jgi:lysozyme
MNQNNNSLHYDQQGLDLTEHSEDSGGPHLKAYWDTTGKCWTCGYGHTHGVTQDTTCTLDLANAWLASDIANSVYAVKMYADVNLSQKEFDALVDFCFNVGAGNFQHSTLLEKINQKDFIGALGEFQKWDISGGEVLPGLRSRRRAEAILFALGTDFTQQNPST